MNEKTVKSLIILVAVALVALVVIWWLTRIDWREHYTAKEVEPYGGNVLQQMLENASQESFFTVNDTIYNQLSLDTLAGNASYVYLGNRLYLDSAEGSFLLDFVEKGNNAYILSKNQSRFLLDTLFTLKAIEYDDAFMEFDFEPDFPGFLFEESYIETSLDSVIRIHITETEEIEEGLRVRWVIDEEPVLHNWHCWKEDVVISMIDSLSIISFFGPDTLDREQLAFSNFDHVNCIRLSHGKGAFYLHTNPELFTNYHLREQPVFEYVDEIFSDLKTEHIIWDEYNRIWQPGPETEGDGDYEGEGYSAEDGPLSFILAQKELRYAWYFLLLGVLLFFLFGARRNQRVVPVRKLNKNTSIEYSETVGQLYMRQGNHRPLCMLKMKLFLAFIREHYALRTNVNSDELSELMRKISIKSDIAIDQVKDIFRIHKQLEQAATVSPEQLVRFHRMLEHFYNNCK